MIAGDAAVGDVKIEERRGGALQPEARHLGGTGGPADPLIPPRRPRVESRQREPARMDGDFVDDGRARRIHVNRAARHQPRRRPVRRCCSWTAPAPQRAEPAVRGPRRSDSTCIVLFVIAILLSLEHPNYTGVLNKEKRAGLAENRLPALDPRHRVRIAPQRAGLVLEVAHAAAEIEREGGAAAVAAALLAAGLVAGNAEVGVVAAEVVEARLAGEAPTAIGRPAGSFALCARSPSHGFPRDCPPDP